MRNKFIRAAGEIVLFNLLALFLVYRLFIASRMEAAGSVDESIFIVRSGLWIFVGIYLIGMILLGIHIYLKTPLTSISGFIETLQQGAAEDPEIRTRFIDIIAIETSRLKRLIEDLLVLSDIENRKESADVQEFSAKEEIEKTVQTLQPIAEDKNVELITGFDEDVVILGSPDRFRQMMVNLIENAVKYSEEGGRVWIEARKLDTKVQVTVKDEGIGIAEEHLDRLFERFYRVDKSRSAKAGGTGLGLSIVKHIAALFNAELKVESKVGEGSIFYVIFER